MPKSVLEQRVQRLEDIEEIRSVTARYAHAVNKGWDGKPLDPEAIPALYAPDAHWTSPDFGTIDGAAEIAAALPEATAMVDASMHAFVNPIITIDGDTASATWQLWAASVIRSELGSVYMPAELTYTRTPSGWRIQSVHLGEAKRGRFAG